MEVFVSRLAELALQPRTKSTLPDHRNSDNIFILGHSNKNGWTGGTTVFARAEAVAINFFIL